MKKMVCLFMVLSVIILLAGCQQPNHSPDGATPTDGTGPTDSTKPTFNIDFSEIFRPTEAHLSDEELLKVVAPQLDIPENAAIRHEISGYIGSPKHCTYKDIRFYENDALVAGAIVDAADGDLVQDIYKYDPANMCFYRYFQDEFFARNVAFAMKKAPHEAVTEEELASFAGDITASSGVKSLTGIGYLKSLTGLSMGKGILEEIPSEITQCKNLKRLGLYKMYDLRKLPENIGQLQELEYIDLALTAMESLPESIGELKKLKYLDASSTNITAVPESIGNCESLMFLDLHNTDITEIPDSVTKLKNLKSLDLGYTKITALPENIGALSELVRLDLFGLDLRHLPESTKNLTKLAYLNVYDNYNLDEEYKQWFPNKCYECATDPRDSEDWYDGI